MFHSSVNEKKYFHLPIIALQLAPSRKKALLRKPDKFPQEGSFLRTYTIFASINTALNNYKFPDRFRWPIFADRNPVPIALLPQHYSGNRFPPE